MPMDHGVSPQKADSFEGPFWWSDYAMDRVAFESPTPLEPLRSLSTGVCRLLLYSPRHSLPMLLNG